MHEIKINNNPIRIPSCWDGLNRKQLEVIAGLSLLGCEEMQFKTHLLFYIAGIHVKKTSPDRNPDNQSEYLYEVKLQNSSIAFLSSSQITELANLFNFLFKITSDKEEKKAVAIDSHLTVNLVPRFKIRSIYYYGPSEKLFNITMSEFIHAETNLSRYTQSKDIQYLDRLIAILYRPQDPAYDPDSPNFSGDRRAPFNDHRFEARAKKIHKLRHNVKLSILFFYQGCQEWYRQQFPHVFKPSRKKSENNLGFLNLVDALTGGDVTKTEEIRKSYLMDVMVHLERAAIDYENLEQKLKKK